MKSIKVESIAGNRYSFFTVGRQSRRNPLATVSYREGTWFGVPLRNKGFAAGLIARKGKNGCLFGYFFGPVCRVPPTRKMLDKLNPEDSVHLAMFGDLNLRKGAWPVVFTEEHWNRSRWPLPAFARIDEKEGKAWLSFYSEDDLTFIREERFDPKTAANYPVDRLAGAGALEIRLTKILTAAKAW